MISKLISFKIISFGVLFYLFSVFPFPFIVLK